MSSGKKSLPSMTSGDAATITVRLQPRARRDEIVGVRNGVLVARVSAPALQGRANEALGRLIACHLGVRRSQVSIVRGERSRDKLVRVAGVDRTQLKTLLGVSA
jgi:uncharacterized protein (TIGR00251 family)